MDSLGSNPFSILTFIVAPAILTNASSVMALGTSNRFARTIDRVRALAAQVEGREHETDPEIVLRLNQLHYVERRTLLLVRALTAFYLSVGSFAAAGLLSLLGAVFLAGQQDIVRHIVSGAVLCVGMLGVGGLVGGCGLLVWETRMALRILTEETKFRLSRPHRKPVVPQPGP